MIISECKFCKVLLHGQEHYCSGNKNTQDIIKYKEKQKITSELGEKLKNARQEIKMSIKKVADKTGFSYQYIWQIENGVQSLGYNNLNILATMYNADKKELAKLKLKETTEYKEYLTYVKTIK